MSRQAILLTVAFFLGLFHLFLPTPALGFDSATFISFVNPVRGDESWPLKNQDPLSLPKFQYQLASPSGTPITWLLRYDAVNNLSISQFFSQLTTQDTTQELGAFLEITPRLAQDANVIYPPGEYISSPNRIFLTGYTQADRIKLIDTYMNLFLHRYGFYPKVVGAWYIDSYSLSYLQQHYSILAAVICDEQYATDNYRIWGGYLGQPYFPSKKNTLVPASNPTNKINLAVVKWASRDPFNFYNTPSASTYSIQVNDYLGVGETTSYLDSLLNIYHQRDFNEFSHLVIGLENDYELTSFNNELKKQFALLTSRKVPYELKPIKLSDFGDWFKRLYPLSSPSYFFATHDFSHNRQPGIVYWFQNPSYRIGLKTLDGQTSIIDFRLYSPLEAEPYYTVPNFERTLYAEIPALIDTVKSPKSTISFPSDLSQFVPQKHFQELILKHGDQQLIFQPDRVIFDHIPVPPINTRELKVVNQQNSTTWIPQPQSPINNSFLSYLLIIILLIIVFFYTTIYLHLPISLSLIGLAFAAVCLLTVFKSGLVYDYGLGLWGPNGHDAIFHLSLAQSFAQRPFDFSNPQLSGAKLQSYHFAFDYLTGIISRLTGLSTLDLYFRYIPIILALSLVILVIKLLTSWQWSRLAIIFSLFGIFLTGSLGFISRLLFDGQLFSGESVFWANQSVSLFLNPPFALSLVILLFFFNLLPKNNWLTLSLLGGFLAQTKVYAFILLCLALFYQRRWRLFLGAVVFGAVLLLPFLGVNQGFPFELSPLWFVRSLFQAYDRLPWPQLAQAWQVYESLGVFSKLILVNLFATTVFILGNLGIRIFGLIYLSRHHSTTLNQGLVATIIILGFAIPLLFIQKNNPWNTIQFIYYSLFFLSLFTGKYLADVFISIPNKFMAITICLLLLILSLVTTVGTLRDYIPYQSSSRVSHLELRALDTLKHLPRGTVVSPIFEPSASKIVGYPKSLYAYVSTAYISALSDQPEYLSDTINLDITGFDYHQHLKNVQRLYRTRDAFWIRNFLKENKITYVYETPLSKLLIQPELACLVKIFDSGEINLYKYSCP